MTLDDTVKAMFQEYTGVESTFKIFKSPKQYEQIISNPDLLKKVESNVVNNHWIPGLTTLLGISRDTILAGLDVKKQEIERFELGSLDRKDCYQNIVADVKPEEIGDLPFLQTYWAEVAADLGAVDKDVKLSDPAGKMYLASQIHSAVRKTVEEDDNSILEKTLQQTNKLYSSDHIRLRAALKQQGVDERKYMIDLANRIANAQVNSAERMYEETEEKEGKKVPKYNREADVKYLQEVMANYVGEKAKDKGILARAYNVMENTKKGIQEMQKKIEEAKKKAEEEAKKAKK